jgi:flagellin
MLSTLEDHYALISSHVQRVRDLTEQAANGTYGQQSKDAIESEIKARLEEINRIAANCEFNDIALMAGATPQATTGLDIQVGTDSSATKSQIHLDKKLFANGNVVNLFDVDDYEVPTSTETDEDKKVADITAKIAKDCAGNTSVGADTMLDHIDKVINKISERITTLGAAQNRIESAIESIGVQSENITSSLSTLRDADVAQESSNYIKAQILQQASATLLATANQTPSIALNLL